MVRCQETGSHAEEDTASMESNARQTGSSSARSETRASARLTSERLAVWATMDHEVAEPVITGEQKSWMGCFFLQILLRLPSWVVLFLWTVLNFLVRHFGNVRTELGLLSQVLESLAASTLIRKANFNMQGTLTSHPPHPLRWVASTSGKAKLTSVKNQHNYTYGNRRSLKTLTCTSIFEKLAYLDSVTAKSIFNFSLFDSSAPLTLNIHVFLGGDNLDLPMSTYPKIKMEARSWLIPPTNPSSMFKQHQMWNVGIYIYIYTYMYALNSKELKRQRPWQKWNCR